jgi:hypothetical protein
MSLVRLLTAGKSLVGGANDSASRYRMANPAAMPKFHASKNPFRAADGSNVKAEISTAKEVGGGVECQVPSVTCQVSEVARQAPTGSGGRSPVGRSLGRLQRVISWSCGLVVLWSHVLGGLWARSFGAVWSGLLTRRATPMAAKFTKAAVQPELSLDRITVMRNDLSDADLEVAPASRSRGDKSVVEDKLKLELQPGDKPKVEVEPADKLKVELESAEQAQP